MAQTLLEAAKFIQNDLFSAIALSVVRTDAMAAVLPFVGFQGTALNYIREGTLPQTSFIPDDGTLMAPTNATFDQVLVPIRRIGSDFDIDSLAADLSSEEISRQLIMKSKATWMLACDRIVNGGWTTSHTITPAMAAITAVTYGPWLDSNRFGPGNIQYKNTGKTWAFRAPGDPQYGTPVAAATNGVYVLKSFNQNKYVAVTINVAAATADAISTVTFESNSNEFDGMKRLISPEMEIPSTGADGDLLSFGVLDDLMLLEKTNVNRAFIMSGKGINKLKELIRDGAGGSTPNNLALPGYTGSVLTYYGVPVLQNDNIKNDEVKGSSSNLTSVYLASLDGDEGLFMGYPTSNTQAQLVRADPRDTTVMGWRVEALGALEDKAWRRWRVQLYGALGLRSSLSLARAKEIKI